MVLSGFILSHTYLYRADATTLGRFVCNRLARMYPLHVFSLVILVAVSYLVGRGLPAYTDAPWWTLFQQLTLTHNIGLPPQALSWNRIAWIVSVVFWVNMYFFLGIHRETGSITLFAASLVGLGLIYCKTGHLDVTAGNYFVVVNAGMVRGLASFFLGVISYRLYLRGADAPWVRKYCTALEVICLLAVVLVVFARSGKYSSLDFLAPFIFMLALALFALENGLISRWLRPFDFLGTISYSLYLNQIAVLMLVRFYAGVFFPGIFFELALYLVVLFGYSYCTWRYIEKPLRDLGKRLLG